MRRAIEVTLAVACVFGAVSTSAAQRRQGTPGSMGAFVGFIKNSVNKGPVRSADLRLYFIDSTSAARDSSGSPYLETFIDTARSRLAVSDSTGYFTTWRLAAGRYLLSARRIGFSPVQAIVTIDTSTVLYEFTMEPVAPMLAAVEINETGISRGAARRLERSGFTNRSHFGEGEFLTPAQIMKRRPLTLRDVLSVYGMRESATYIIDGMPLEYEDIAEYPAELIAGIEIYRHNRPIQFGMTRRGPGVLGRGGGAYLMRPMVVIWTYVP